LILGGCSSPEKATKQAKEAAGSWGATLSAAAEQWSTGEISAGYFATVVTQARTSLQKEAQRARTSAGDSAAAPVDAVASHVDAMADAVKRGDRAAAVHAARAAASEVAARKTPPVARPQ
jgi:hypothetical protein